MFLPKLCTVLGYDAERFSCSDGVYVGHSARVQPGHQQRGHVSTGPQSLGGPFHGREPRQGSVRVQLVLDGGLLLAQLPCNKGDEALDIRHLLGQVARQLGRENLPIS